MKGEVTPYNRDGSIDILKFLMAIVIVIFHGYVFYDGSGKLLFNQGAYGVECFFIISGYYMAKSCFEKKTDPLLFILGRIKGIFPYHIFAFSLAFLTLLYLRGLLFDFSLEGLKDVIILLIRAIPEFLILPPLAGLEYDLVGVIHMEWYLSALFLAMSLLYPMLLKWQKKFSLYIAPAIFLFLSGYLYQKAGTYRVTTDYGSFLGLGLVRGIALVAIGTTVYYLAKDRRIEYSASRKWFNTFLSIGSWAIVLMYFNSKASGEMSFAVVYFIIIGIYLEAIKGTHLSILFNNKISSYLGRLSIPMFLNQEWIRDIISKADLGLSYYKSLLLFLVLTIAVSIVCLFVVDFFLIKRINNKN